MPRNVTFPPLYGPYKLIFESGFVPIEKDYSGNFAEFYDVVQPALDDLPFYEYLIGKFGGPILELGCGSGRLLIPLAAKGYNIVGLDKSSDLLKVLERKISVNFNHLRNKIVLVEADMRNFQLSTSFSVIIIAMDTFQILSKKEDRIDALKCVFNHLKGNGIVIIDISPTKPKTTKTLPTLNLFHDTNRNCMISISQEFHHEINRTKILNFLNIYFREKRPTEITISAAEEWYGNPDELKTLLINEGFKIQATYSNYKFRKYRKYDSNIIIVAQKQ